MYIKIQSYHFKITNHYKNTYYPGYKWFEFLHIYLIKN